MANISTHQIGRVGEGIVAGILKNCIWNNSIKEGGDYFDLIWEGIKIDVKTSTYKLRNGFQISSRVSSTGKKDVVFVYVAIEDDKHYFWVVQYPKTGSAYIKLKDSIIAEELPGVLRKYK